MPTSSPNQEQTKDMFAAIRAGQVSKVKKLLRAGISPDVKDPSYFKEPALSAAARAGQEEVFLELVKAGANLHALDELKGSVLEQAAAYGTQRMVQVIIADGLQPTDGLLDAFRFACCSAGVDVVKTLIAAGADVNRKSTDGDSPLITAVQYQRAEIVAELLEQGARTDVRVPRDELGDNKHYKKTALELAAAEGYTEIVKLLKGAGAKAPPKPKRPTQPAAIADSWKRINKWLKQNAQGWKPLGKGATDKQLARAEKQLAFQLPAELRESYRIHDGDGSSQVFPCPDDISYYLASLDEVVSSWQMLKGLLDMGDFKGAKAKCDKGIKKEWWNPAWVPFASNGGGDYLCIDTGPAPGGKPGQVILWRHDSEKRSLLAPSLRVWLFELANGLEDGKCSYDEENGLM